MPQHTVRLPITCVEGWSADGTWKGVRLRDILDSIGAPHHAHVRIESLEKGGLYRSSIVNPSHARDPLTLLATHLNGKVLDPDHGYPLRLIAPDRPGVLQTKWISQVVVLA
jgi:DMSO/TMAO reductase YedYZ molybdopterin-dependent catalytic subunit